MTKFKKFLASLLSCCLALVLVIAAGCSAPEDSSGSSSASTSSSEEASSSSSATSSSESSSSSATTSSSEASSSEASTSETSTSETSTSETSSSEASSSEASSSETSSSEADTSDDDDYTLTSTTVYFVGDSTVCEFSDSYYLPRYGYGTQFYNYIDTDNVTVKNLALSGRSSKSFISESNYTTLTSSITKGDYLIIGFGHNDEKSDDADRYTAPTLDAVNTTGSFQYYLYNYYIKVAEEAGATPILCTPIVRYNSSANYAGSSGHVTSDGDYAACIRDLAEDYNVTCVDLTSITTNLYTTLGSEAQWFHAFSKAKLASDSDAMSRSISSTDGTTVTVVPDGIDTTHINMYGAKMISYQIATALQSARKTCNLGYYVLNSISEPTITNDFEAAYNTSYTYKPYSTPDLSSLTAFDTITDSTEGSSETYNLYSTAFGDLGGSTKYKNYSFTNNNGTYTIDNTGSVCGKITDKIDSMGAIFTQISKGVTFTASVKATVTGINASLTSSTQSAFGLALRDDIYINTYDAGISTNYVATGALDLTSGYAMFSRESETLSKSNNLGAITTGTEYTLSITGGGQVFVVTLTTTNSTTPYTVTYTDFSFTATDENYLYLCMFVTRGIAVEFSDFTFAITGDAQSA